MQKAAEELEKMGEDFERESKRDFIQQRAKPKQQSSESPLANLSLEDMMA
jgi:hypothetical protein